jgi:hypothetical protein
MLANSCASAGGTVASRCTRPAADACSAARSWAIVTRPGAARAGLLVGGLGEACAIEVPAGWMSLARSRARCS